MTPALQQSGDDPRADLLVGGEEGAAVPVLDELDRGKQALAAHLADVPVVADGGRAARR